MVSYITAEFGEQQIDYGLNEITGYVEELFANGETGTWTILETSPYGDACIIGVGYNFFFAPPPAKYKL